MQYIVLDNVRVSVYHQQTRLHLERGKNSIVGVSETCVGFVGAWTTRGRAIGCARCYDTLTRSYARTGASGPLNLARTIVVYHEIRVRHRQRHAVLGYALTLTGAELPCTAACYTSMPPCSESVTPLRRGLATVKARYDAMDYYSVAPG
jgi:hypothetical protein